MKKYLIYIIGLPVISFLSKLILGPLTTGAHDGGYLAFSFGAICGFTIFISIVLKINKFITIPIGIIIGSLFVYTSSELNYLLFFDPNLEFWEIGYRDFWTSNLKENSINTAMAIAFFTFFIISTVGTIEIMKRLIKKTAPNN